MILRSAGVSVAIVLLGLAAQAEARTKVFLLGGQSNMVGFGEVAQLTPPYNATQAVKLWSSGQWVDLQGGYGASSAYFGPELSFGYTLAETVFPQDDIYLVKYAAGSSSLDVDWNPDGSGGCYNIFKDHVDAALANLTDAHLSPQIAGMIWMQGESDANKAAGPLYAANLTNFIDTVRNDFAAPDMRFVLGRISSFWYSTGSPGDPGVDFVRDAQMTVPELAGNAAWVDTDDLPMSLANPGHYGTQGQIDLGIRFADNVLETPVPSTLVQISTGMLALTGYWWIKRKWTVIIKTRELS